MQGGRRRISNYALGGTQGDRRPRRDLRGGELRLD
jgi:hypothetical protein